MELKRSYRVLRGVAKRFVRKSETVWDVPYDGEPAVFVPNHARAWGPLDMALYFELTDNSRIWYNAGVIDRKNLPAYIRNDDWWNPKSKLAWFYNITVPYICALLLPPVFKCTPDIPVYYDNRVTTTFRQSTQAIKNGENLVIFAQLPNGYQSHDAHLIKGFLLIAPLAWRRCGVRLKFYPVHIDHDDGKIHVMKPIAFDPDCSLEDQEQEMLEYLETRVYD